jgi:hypothetical protein
MDAAPATLMYVSVLVASRLPKPKTIGNSLLGGFNETTVQLGGQFFLVQALPGQISKQSRHVDSFTDKD